MNLLYDFICISRKHGASEYIRRIFFELWGKIQKEQLSVNIFALYDSRYPIAYEDMRENCFNGKITFVDATAGIDILCKENKIDRLFIGCAQGFIDYPEIENVECSVICVTHDLVHEERYFNKLEVLYKLLAEDAEDKEDTLTWKGRFRWKSIFGLPKYDKFSIWYIGTGGNKQYANSLKYMQRFVNLYHKNKKFHWITVSEYTKSSIVYYLGIPADDIEVLYSPERIIKGTNEVEDETLSALINSGKKYYLIVSADRISKNATKAIKAFKRFAELHPETYLLTVGYQDIKYPNHICCPFLSEGDLAKAYKNCYALIFPSFFEGFGYPPTEAMRYGKPVLCSNTTSMPEILGNAPILFSPLYESGIFDALCKLSDENYEIYKTNSLESYNIIHKRQELDLQKMIEQIIR